MPARPVSVPARRVLSTLLVLGVLVASAAGARAAAQSPPGVDSDGDGAPDAVERDLGLNPRAPDPIAWVDGQSIAGACSDNRTADVARTAATPWCSLGRAAAAAPAGALVIVRRGDYPRLTTSSQRAGIATLRGYPGENVALPGAELQSGRIRLEAFSITGTVVVKSNVSEVQLVGNSWTTDGRSGGTNLVLEGGVSDVLVERNQIAQAASVGSANAINFSSTDTLPPISRVTIRGNRIGPLPGGGDAIQAKNTRGLLVEDNEIFGVTLPPGSRAHPDVLQSIFGAVDMVVRRNFIHDIAAQGIFIQSYRGENRGFQASDNVITRVSYPWVAFTFSAVDARVEHNTIQGTLRVGAATRNASVVANIATGVLTPNDGAQLAEQYNLSGRFQRKLGPGSIVGRPRFQGPDRNDYRLHETSLGRGAAPGGVDMGSRYADWSPKVRPELPAAKPETKVKKSKKRAKRCKKARARKLAKKGKTKRVNKRRKACAPKRRKHRVGDRFKSEG